MRKDGGSSAQIVVVMGVSGAGKTTVGRALAERLGWEFQEGDALHPPENVAKMRAGHPLADADRLPWLRRIAERIDEWRRRGECGLVTCSALKRQYRDIVIDHRPELRLVYLEGSKELIAGRLAKRRGHFMPPSLLDSQFAALEPPTPDEHPIVISVAAPVADNVARLAALLAPAAAAATR